MILLLFQGRHHSYHWNGSRVDFARHNETRHVLAVYLVALRGLIVRRY